MASESCSTSSSSSGDDFVPIFFASQSNEVTPQKLRQEAEYGRWNRRSCSWSSVWWKRKRSRLGLCVRLLLQWGTHSGVSAESASRGIGDRTALLFWLCRARGESSLSVERLHVHVDLQLSRSTCHCLHAFSFSYLFWTALRDFLDMTKRPLSASPSNKWVEIFCFSPLALLCPVDGSFIHHCLYFFYKFKFSQFRACSDWSRRAATQQTSSKFLVARKSMKAQAILSMLVALAAAESATEDRFQRRRPTRLTVSRTRSARSSRRSKAMELSTRGKADADTGRVLPKSPARKKFRDRFTSTCLPQSRFLCDRRPTSAAQVVSWKSVLRELQTKYTSINSHSGSQKSEV